MFGSASMFSGTHRRVDFHSRNVSRMTSTCKSVAFSEPHTYSSRYYLEFACGVVEPMQNADLTHCSDVVPARFDRLLRPE